MEKQKRKTIKNSHTKEFGGHMPRKRPRDKFGTSHEHSGRLGRFMLKFEFKAQNVRGTDGTYDRTDGTCP